MANKTSVAKGPRMSDAAVQAKTGKNWKEWFSLLDKAGARKLTHQEIVKTFKRKARCWTMVATDGDGDL